MNKNYYGIYGKNGYGVYDDYEKVQSAAKYIVKFNNKKFLNINDAKMYSEMGFVVLNKMDVALIMPKKISINRTYYLKDLYKNMQI